MILDEDVQERLWRSVCLILLMSVSGLAALGHLASTLKTRAAAEARVRRL